MTGAIAPIDQIFWQAAQLAGEARDAYLADACGGDAELRQRVEQLLHVHPKASAFLEQPFEASGAPVAACEAPGSVIGPYKLLEQIGEGGMGLVFMAEQTEPIRRLVALKVLKPGMDTREVVARFEVERQALALMDHPNIAKIFDAGTVASGQWPVAREETQDPSALATDHWPLTTASRPYFVMELVKGPPITEFCDQHRLTTRHRLELFVTVCHAVQHAHQKGIIHRDLKPSNVLVTLPSPLPSAGEGSGVRGIPKVIDFGIAKATGQRLTEQTLFTHFAQVLGSPLYMSPEQAQMNGLDVDTRSDIYSLGVMLYELLTGTTPFVKETLKEAGFDEMRRLIREEEPPRPSHRVSTLSADACSTVHAQRGVDNRRLSDLLRGELDWIVMKSLEKDRNRRYESASALAADVQRYLNDEPVEACPPSRSYRVRKFARRHKAVLIMSTLVAMALVIGSGVSLWQAIEATDARDLADLRLKKQNTALANETAALKLADIRLEEQQRALADKVAALAEKDKALAVSGARLELVEKHLERGVKGIAALLKLTKPSIAEEKKKPAMVDEKVALLISVKNKYLAADANYTHALEILEDMERRPPAFFETRLELNRLADNLAERFGEIHRLEKQAKAQHASNRLWELMLVDSPEHPFVKKTGALELASGSYVEGTILNSLARYAEAERALRRSREMFLVVEKQGALREFPESLQLFQQEVKIQLGEALARLGKTQDAKQLFQEALKELKSVNPILRERFLFARVRAWEGNGDLLWLLGRQELAKEHYARAIADHEQLVRLRDRDGQYRRTFAWFLVTCPDQELRNLPRAIKLAEEASEAAQFNPTNWRVLGVALLEAGDYKNAWNAFFNSSRLRGERDMRRAFDPYHSAILKWKLGEKAVALSLLETGDYVLKGGGQFQDPRLVRIRAKTAAVLGLSTDVVGSKGKNVEQLRDTLVP